MQPLKQVKGIVAALDRANVDTDQIIPKQFLKRIERTGFGEFLFYDWRYRADGSPNPDFELNHPAFRGASILVTGKNFGCGSSREHAPWALSDYGIRVIIASSFADIFFNNCFQNGMLLIRMDEAIVADLFKKANDRNGYELTVDLESQSITDEGGLSLRFEVDAFRRHCLLNGLDDIGMTLQIEDRITEYEAKRKRWLVGVGDKS